MRRELAGLLDDESLRATALAHLRCGLTVETTARALFVHPNTVRYRIGRIEERLGCRISERAAMLQAALSWVEIYGPDRLR